MSLIKGGVFVATLVLVAAGAMLWLRRSRVAAPVAVSTFNPENMSDFKKPDPELLKKKLSPEQFAVTQRGETEPAFRNAYWDHHKPGLYVDVVSGEPLFSSQNKFDSGTGWPSFTRPLAGVDLTERMDGGAGAPRTEVRSKLADSHLGHVFDDGPADQGGKRYCINSAALQFVPVLELQQAGYGPRLTPFVAAGLVPKPALESAILAGGCFWGMEEILRQIPGVTKATVGYSGGQTTNPTYEDICTGRTGHAEAVELVFDANRLSYEDLLGYFFRMHDPTTLNRQHNDVGTQYRSAIFYSNEEQKKTAERVRATLDAAKKFKRPITTEITAAARFYPAEDYHQKYLVKNPGGYNCHVLRD